MDIAALLSSGSDSTRQPSPPRAATRPKSPPATVTPAPKIQLPPLPTVFPGGQAAQTAVSSVHGYQSRPMPQRNMGHGYAASASSSPHRATSMATMGPARAQHFNPMSRPIAANSRAIYQQHQQYNQQQQQQRYQQLQQQRPQQKSVAAEKAMSDSSDSSKDRLSPEVMRALLRWLVDHAENPYPTDQEKRDLQAEHNLSTLQINNWFINARRRVLRKLVKLNMLDHPDVVDIAEKMVRRGRRAKTDIPVMSTRMAEQQSGIRFDKTPGATRQLTPPVSMPSASEGSSREREALDILASLAAQPSHQ